MNKRLSGFLLLIATLALTLVPHEPGQSAPSTWTPNDKLVAAYYFYWYNIYTGEHFVDPDGTDAITNHPHPNYLANYSYTEVSWHRRELLDMMKKMTPLTYKINGREVGRYSY